MARFIEFPESPEKHRCTGTLEDGIIVFRCNECSFERRLNPSTGILTSHLNNSDPYTQHEGIYYSDEVKASLN